MHRTSQALTVPITVLVFSLPLPYLPYLPSVLGGQFMLGLAILLVRIDDERASWYKDILQV
jgi:hypothetical protein